MTSFLNIVSLGLKRVGLDYFLLTLLVMIGLAYFWPALGVAESPLPLQALATYGVAGIFFFYGLRLSLEKLKVGLRNWQLHLVVQLSTFLLFPLLVLLGQYVFNTGAHSGLWLGAFYLAALPSTVSSSVVMVSIAGGNIPAAIFNASISGLLGLFLTPLWMSLFLESSSGAFNVGAVMGKLSFQVLLPVVLGILLHQRFGAFAEQHKSKLRLFDQTIILTIVFTSFSESFARDMFQNVSLPDILWLGIYLLAFFFLVYSIISVVSRLLRFNREDQITAQFCGSKKSLVHGSVMSKVLFPDANVAGLVLLPLMLYHALQLIAVSMLAQAMARKKAAGK